MRSRDVWAEIAEAAGIPIVQKGLIVAARRPEAQAVLEAFAATEMGRGCETSFLGRGCGHAPAGIGQDRSGALPAHTHQCGSRSRTAIGRLAGLASPSGAAPGFFRRTVVVHAVDGNTIETSRGSFEADTVIVCPGDDFGTLFADRLATYKLTRCKLHMSAPRRADDRHPRASSVMSDLGLVRYLGYAELPEAQALKVRLEAEQAAQLENGVHLIVVASADGSLVVGDSHHYAPTPDPFAPEAVDDLILEEFRAVLPGYAELKVAERWIGTYASASDRLALIDKPSERVRLVTITSGTGASTSFAIGEEVIGELFD